MAVFTEMKSQAYPLAWLFRQSDQTMALPPATPETTPTSDSLDQGMSYDWLPGAVGTATNGTGIVGPTATTAEVAESLNDDLVRLELAAKMATPDDVSPFVAVYQQIDWMTRRADDFAQATRLALSVGAHLIARECALAGRQRFPDHPELQKMARVLSPPKARSVPRAGSSSWPANRAWLKQHWDDYRGHWVALRDGQLLAVADDVDGLVAQVGKLKDTNILVTPVW